jgi:L-2,4-diaminobutyric acid acetyltransferase
LRSELALARPRLSDAPAIVALARRTSLDENSSYAYLLMCRDFDETCVVARDRDDDRVVGFVTGFRRPSSPDTVFVWQIATAEDVRGRGVARAMLDELLERTGAEALEATVTETNTVSFALFRATARAHGWRCSEEVLFDSSHFPCGEGHETEVLVRLAAPAERSTSRPRQEERHP